ncbi:Laminin G domain protein [compost metagenome]
MANIQENMDRCGVAWFKFDETSSSQVIDSKGNNLTATISGTTVVAGVSGNARSFNNNYIRFQGTVIPYGKKSIRFKIKTTQTSTGFPHILKTNSGSSDSTPGFYWMISGGGGVNFANRSTSGTASIYASSPINDGQWHDVLYTQSGPTPDSDINIYVDDMITPVTTSKLGVTEASSVGQLVIGGNLLSNTLYNGFIGQIDEFEVYNDVISALPDSTLVFHQGEYKYYLNGTWLSLDSTISDSQFKQYGMANISTIPEDAWKLLNGEIELCTWTDAVNKNQISYSVTTEPFTLGDEWANKEIQIIEYTDDPNQTESSITLETEPFTLYDELGDNVDVLYYTDDPTITDPKLNITANYSPLDELEGDFDVVTWSDSDTVPNIESSIIPSPQVVVQTEPYTIYGDLLALVSKLVSENGRLRFAVSFNGREWKSWRYGEWRTIDIHDLLAFKQDGMSHYDLNRMKSSELANYDSIQLAYYIEDNIHNSDPGTSLDAMQLKVNAATDTVKLEDLVFNVVNTKATIQLSLSGNKLLGKLEDSDMGKVQYRILLNGVPYFPSDGQFTSLTPSPLHIDFNVSERDIKFNQLNTLKVEFQDYWGDTDYWETSFTGAYSGLMFMDESGEYLSDTFGGILKYLDFDVIFAGQTTIDQKVVIKNQLGYPLDELLLKVNESKLPEGVQIELSRQQSPFLPTNYITYGYTDIDQTQEFYVRIVTDLNAKTIPDGIFELNLNAKRTI